MKLLVWIHEQLISYIFDLTDHGNTVKREYLAAIIFGGFSNMAVWQRINLAISHTGNI